MVPKYKPEDVIIFTISGTPHLGKVLGGSVYENAEPDAEWKYIVALGPDDNTETTVESRITHILQDGEYKPVD